MDIKLYVTKPPRPTDEITRNFSNDMEFGLDKTMIAESKDMAVIEVFRISKEKTKITKDHHAYVR